MACRERLSPSEGMGVPSIGLEVTCVELGLLGGVH